MTTIQVSNDDSMDKSSDVQDEDRIVTIMGDSESVKLARKEIQNLIISRVLT